ncbi:MAG TPA: hypothetical protein VF491_20445 [Vicinamibacterales bacterium]
MSERISPELASEIATLIADTFSDGMLQIYAGSPGATADDDSDGTLLCEILLPAVAFLTAADGVISKAGQWFGTATGTGTARWGRFSNRAGDRFMAITLSKTYLGGELTLDRVNIVAGDVVDVSSFAYSVPLS